MPDEPHPRLRIRQFDTFEEMMASISEDHDAATAASTPTQIGIGWGQHVVSYDEYAGLFIFGKIEDEEAFLRYETAEAETEEEAEAIKENIQRIYEDNLRYGRWYSSDLPEGEFGSKHVVTLWPITEDDFKAGKNADWSPTDELLRRVENETIEELVQMQVRKKEQ